MNISEYRNWIDGYFESLLLSEPITQKQVLTLQEKIHEMLVELSNTKVNAITNDNTTETDENETKFRSPDGWKTHT